jgi:hypothetical protein
LLKEAVTTNQLYILCILVVSFLLLNGIITVQNIVDIWKNGKCSIDQESKNANTNNSPEPEV